MTMMPGAMSRFALNVELAALRMDFESPVFGIPVRSDQCIGELREDHRTNQDVQKR